MVGGRTYSKRATQEDTMWHVPMSHIGPLPAGPKTNSNQNKAIHPRSSYSRDKSSKSLTVECIEARSSKKQTLISGFETSKSKQSGENKAEQMSARQQYPHRAKSVFWSERKIQSHMEVNSSPMHSKAISA